MCCKTMESTDLQRVNFEEGYVAVIDKPYRWSSTDVVRKVKFELRKAGYRRIKVGHAGTLDPLATGVLLVCIGRATKQVDALPGRAEGVHSRRAAGCHDPSFDCEHTVDRSLPDGATSRDRRSNGARLARGRADCRRRRSIRPRRSRGRAPTSSPVPASRSRCGSRSSRSTTSSCWNAVCRS